MIEKKQVLTFDCYGTLIDWESGILNALKPILHSHGVRLSDDQVLERFAHHEAEVEAGPFMLYQEVLGTVLVRLGKELGFAPGESQIQVFSYSVQDWPAFPDSAAALEELKQRFKLVILSNISDELFAYSNLKLGVEFDVVITAEQVGHYKPNLAHFHEALRRLQRPAENILHVAQSLFHDHVPAKQLGWDSVWINRRLGKSGSGATPPAQAKPDLEFPDMAGFAAFVA
jgi:2-haloacid dehalogenase